jgi:hypothetical protein
MWVMAPPADARDGVASVEHQVREVVKVAHL